jgi:hypothetical protein
MECEKRIIKIKKRIGVEKTIFLRYGRSSGVPS